MRPRTRRLLLALALATALGLLGVTAALAWLLTTEAGLHRAVAFAESLDAVGIRVQGAGGRLIGPLHADAVEIRHARASIRIEGLDADLEPSALLAGRISVEDLRVGSALVRVHARTEPPKPPAFLPRWLSVGLDGARVGSLEIASPGGAVLRLADVAGGATITRTQLEFRDARADAGAWAVAGAGGRLHAREPLALEGQAAWTLARTREAAGTARFAGDLERLRVEARVVAPGSATAEFELHRLAADFRFDGRARVDSLDLARWIAQPPFGPLGATLEFEGDRRNYAATGRVHGPGLPAGGVEVDAAARYAGGTIEVPRLRTRSPGLLDAEWQGALRTGEDPAWEARARWTAFSWPLAGSPVLRSAAGSAEFAGWREFSFRVDGEFSPEGAPSFGGEAAGRLTAEALVVERSQWRALGGTVSAAGSLARAAPRAWRIAGRAEALDPATLDPRIAGRLDFDWEVSGTGLDDVDAWSAGVAGLSGRLHGLPASGGGTVHRSPGRWRFDRVAFAVGPARLSLDGAIGGGGALDAALVADDLSKLLPELGGRVDAALTVRDRLLTLAFTGHDLAWREHRAVVLSADARLDLDDREPSWLRLRTHGLTLAGQTLADTRLSLDGRMAQHALAFRVGLGEDAIELRGTGAWADGAFRWRLGEAIATGPHAAHWRLESPAGVELAAENARLAPLCLARDARRICVEGHWRRGTDWSARARVEALPLEFLKLRVPGEPEYRGLLGVDAAASAEAGQPWIADLRAEIRDGLLRYVSASGKERTVPLGRTVAVLRSRRDAHRAELRVVDAAETSLGATLVALRDDARPFAELPVTGEVQGATGQLALLPLFLEDIDEASGRLSLQLAVSGRLGAPDLHGQARLEQGSLDFYGANLKLRDIGARLELRDQSLALDATARAGEGTLRIDGRFAWRDRRPTGLMTLAGERLLLTDVPEARVVASPELRFALDGRRLDVTGTVAVPEARIEPAEIAGAVLASPDERIVRAGPEPAASDPFEIATDVRLVLGERVHIDAYGLRGRLSGSVRSWSEPGEPALASGELAIQDGEYRAYTRELDVERGRLLFGGGPVTDPGVDLRASRTLPGHVVGVIVRGRLRRPQLTLYSEPSLPQAQIASLLIVGQSIDRLQGEDRESLAASRAGLAAQGGALLAGQLGRYVGLDEVGLSQGADDTALVLGKFLSPRLYVSYGISLVDEINTLKLRYTIGDRWVISAESGREAAAEIQFRVER